MKFSLVLIASLFSVAALAASTVIQVGRCSDASVSSIVEPRANLGLSNKVSMSHILHVSVSSNYLTANCQSGQIVPQSNGVTRTTEVDVSRMFTGPDYDGKSLKAAQAMGEKIGAEMQFEVKATCEANAAKLAQAITTTECR
jgi:hypothetical protein